MYKLMVDKALEKKSLKAEGVVVSVTPDVFYHDKMGIFVARIPKLGLTAYGGETPETAIDKLERMFVSFVKVHTTLGTLEKRLNASGLEWFMEPLKTNDKEAK